jgi:predicted ATPase
MRRHGAATLLGVSGVDGSGKSTFVTSLAKELEREGVSTVTLYLYGCIVCRRRRTSEGSKDPLGTAARMSCVRSVHPYVDLLEMAIRLASGLIAVRLQGGDVLLTDRSPLDSLVKHEPSPRSAVARWYLRIAKRYRTVFWLCGDTATFAVRDREHTAAQLEEAQMRFRGWAPELFNLVTIDTTAVADRAVPRWGCVLPEQCGDE